MSLSPPGSASYRSPLPSMTSASSPETTITRSPSPYSQHTPDYTYVEGQASSKLARARHFLDVWHSLPRGDADSRPQHPYTDLIKLCILKRSDAKLTLNQLYHDLESKFAFFAAPKNGKGWKVSPALCFAILRNANSQYRTHCATTFRLSPTLSSWTESMVSRAKATTGRTSRISRSLRPWRRAPSCSIRPAGHHSFLPRTTPRPACYGKTGREEHMLARWCHHQTLCSTTVLPPARILL